MNNTPANIAHGIEQLKIGGYTDEAKMLEHFTTNLNTLAELKFLSTFAESTDFFCQLERNQLRSLWTAYCFHADLEVDTASYDTILRSIWGRMTVPDECLDFENYECFDMFMCSNLV